MCAIVGVSLSALFVLPVLFGTGVALAAPCPNEALRTGTAANLPECRAYEQVSPANKDGFGVTFEHLLEGGERVEAESIGLFAGATGSVNCAFTHYDFTREEASGSWRTLPLNDAPLQLAYAGTQCQPAVVNREGAGLLLLHPVAKSVYERDLYRHTAEGQFTPIGPVLPSYAVPPSPAGGREQGKYGTSQFVGATPDLTHTIFTLQPLAPVEEELPPGVKTELWPNDTTILHKAAEATASLYEYVGAEQTEPRLVGLDEGGHLISDCGTYPGGSSGNGSRGVAGNHHNAISSDGETVFFTATGADNPNCGPGAERPAVEELFARIGASRTVAVSEPQGLSPGEPNDGCTSVACLENTSTADESSDWRDANFEGASADGSRVFFTSTQQLLNGASQDPNTEDSAYEQAQTPHKGCRAPILGEHGCNLYEYDFDAKEGERLKLVSGGDASTGPEVQGVTALSEDGSHIYFVAKGVLTSAPNEFGRSATEGEENLYVHDTQSGQTTFIATLAESDNEQWTAIGESPMDVTANGKFLVFTSSAPVVPGTSGTVQQVFLYGAETGTLARVSVGNEGFNDNGDANAGETYIARGGSSVSEYTPIDQHPAVSEDGSTVVFKSSLGLTPEALNDKCLSSGASCPAYAQNIYEYHEGHVYLISSASTAALPTYEGVAAVSPSGADIFFQSREALVPQDTDSLSDIYDARVDGGFTPPSSPSPCAGEGCQGAPSSHSSTPASASEAFSGPELIAPVPPAPPVKKTAAQLRTEALVKALSSCRKAHRAGGAKRKSCEASARKRYGPKAKAKPKKAKAKAKKSARKAGVR